MHALQGVDVGGKDGIGQLQQISAAFHQLAAELCIRASTLCGTSDALSAWELAMCLDNAQKAVRFVMSLDGSVLGAHCRLQHLDRVLQPAERSLCDMHTLVHVTLHPHSHTAPSKHVTATWHSQHLQVLCPVLRHASMQQRAGRMQPGSDQVSRIPRSQALCVLPLVGHRAVAKELSTFVQEATNQAADKVRWLRGVLHRRNADTNLTVDGKGLCT